MAKSSTNPKVDWYFIKNKQWQEEIETLRAIILDCGLHEELKWGCPCYTYEDNNIVLIHVFKEYCAVLFFKGALMKDPKKILIQQTPNVQVPRQVRFANLEEVKKLKTTLKAYVKEAIRVEKSGVKAPLKKVKEFSVPDEFQDKMDEMPALKTAFKALTPGRQRGYLLYFASAKQSKTRAERVEKYTKKILSGKGLDD